MRCVPLLLFIVVMIASSCSRGGSPTSAVALPPENLPLEDLPPVERLRNTGSFRVPLDGAMELEGDFAVPLIDGPYPAVVLANDASAPEDQVKEEARLLARHGFAVLGFNTVEGDLVRQYARAGASVVGQPGALSAQAALVLLSGDPAPAMEVHRRLPGFRVLILIDPEAPPPLEDFVGMDASVVVLYDEETPDALIDAWRDALTLIAARSIVRIEGRSRDETGNLSAERRAALANTVIEFLQ